MKHTTTKTNAAREQLFDPRSREFLADPYATYKLLIPTTPRS